MLLIGLGGFLGSAARYWLAGVAQRFGGIGFPLGTLAVNVLGSFVLGLVMALSLERGVGGGEVRIFLAVGLCGGFTTMSTFSYETLLLLRAGETTLACGNAALTMGACLAAVWLGDLVARGL